MFIGTAYLNEPKLCSLVFLFSPLQWSPLILNPSYTILHFLGATKVVSQHGPALSIVCSFKMTVMACLLTSFHPLLTMKHTFAASRLLKSYAFVTMETFPPSYHL